MQIAPSMGLSGMQSEKIGKVCAAIQASLEAMSIVVS